eukprot:69631-Rhodomonas_salina.1
MSGTDLAYGATSSPWQPREFSAHVVGSHGYHPTRLLRTPYARPTRYAPPTRCPVLTEHMLLITYEPASTDLAYTAIGLECGPWCQRGVVCVRAD